MNEYQKMRYRKRGEILVKNLQKRHFDAYYCDTATDALSKALELIPEGDCVSWGGAMSAQQIGLLDAVGSGNYRTIDRDAYEDRNQAMREALLCDTFISGANALSLDGEMVNIDGQGNRVAAIVYGPRQVIVVAGMNKVMDTLEDAITRARTVAAPTNQQRFQLDNPCTATGTCADCLSKTCICNQILITRHCRPVGRIKFVIVGQDLGM